MIKDVSKSTHLCFVCTMRKPANTYGSVPLSIMHSLDYGHLLKVHQLDRTSSEWAQDLDILEKLNFKPHKQTKLGERYSLKEDLVKGLLGGSRMCLGKGRSR